jgi:cupin fold WbuC family metalloprotein
MSSVRALKPPAGDVVWMKQEHVQLALDASHGSDRLRMILPFHKHDEDPLHRMFNALQPGTYVPPHRHSTPPKAEVFLLLRGAMDFIVFDESGELTHVARLAAGSENFGVDVAPGLYHSFLVREPDTLIYEVKLGPYRAADAKDFAPWAPAEGACGVAEYVRTLEARIATFAR